MRFPAITVGVFLIISGCTNNKRSEQKPETTDTSLSVTNQIQQPILYKVDTVYIPCADRHMDSVRLYSLIDSLHRVTLVHKYKIERIKYYLSIVDRNPSQIKFLRSWIRRAVQ